MLRYLIAAFLLLAFATLTDTAVHNADEVLALQELYRNVFYPPQLLGWKSSGGDPCSELWQGITCLVHLKVLDIGSNSFFGEVPYMLSPNLIDMDMSCNNFSGGIPYSISSLKHLFFLNLSHNALSWPVGNAFNDMRSLKLMDLSSNKFSGTLPRCFEGLSNLTTLFIQNNHFSGSIRYLVSLPLVDLNIENNAFVGVIPDQVQKIPHLWTRGNAFDVQGDHPSWNSRPDDLFSPPTFTPPIINVADSRIGNILDQYAIAKFAEF